MADSGSGEATSSIRGVGSRWIGAIRDLGLRVEWRAAFVGAGRRVRSAPDTVVVDVGGELCPGVIDHHSGTASACSAAALVVEHPDLVHAHLVGPWMDEARRREVRGIVWRPTIVTHVAPDFDAIASVAIVRQLVEDGGLPPWCHALAQYATEVDQGRELLRLEDGSLELYPLVLMLSVLEASVVRVVARELCGDAGEESPDAARLQSGLALVRLWCEALAGSGARSADSAARIRLPAAHPAVSRLSAELQRDFDRFRLARDQGHVRPLPVGGWAAVPVRDGDGLVRLRAAISGSVEDVHRSSCGKHFLRAGLALPERHPLTVIRLPSAAPGRNRWIISVDPTSEGPGGRACLAGLGVSLEVEEERRRGGLEGPANASRRGSTRFEFAPGIADPWYDGRGHQFTIVDSPHEGTVLDEADVLRIVGSRFWEPEVASCAQVVWREVDEAPRAIDLLASLGVRPRLGEVIERMAEQARSLDATNVLVAVGCSERWGPEPIARAARCVAGVGVREVDLGGLHAFIGPRGVFLHAAGGVSADVLEDVRAEIDRAESLLRHMRHIDREIATGSVRASAEVRTDHVRRVSRYYLRDGQRSSPEALQVAAALAEVHSIEARVRGVGELLERLDDVDERVRGTRLNLIVLVLGSTGFLQVMAALLDLTGWHEDHPWLLWGLKLASAALLAAMAIVATDRGRRFLLGRRWIQGLVGGG